MTSTSSSVGEGSRGWPHLKPRAGLPAAQHSGDLWWRLRKLLSGSSLIRYFICGSVAAMSQLLILAALVEIGELRKTAASVIALYISIVINYFLQKRFTFGSSVSNWRALPKFLATSTAGVCINTAIFVTLLSFFHYLIAQCIALLAVFMFNYTVSRMFIFRKAT